MIRIKVAGLAIGIDNRFEYVRELASDYLTDEEPLFTVAATDAELEAERSISEHDFSNGYLESIVAYRKIAEQLPRFDAFVFREDRRSLGLRDAQTVEQRIEEFAVFRLLDALERCSENLDLTHFENALLGELHGEVQSCLSAQSRDDCVGTLVADDFGDVFEFERLHIDLVGDMGVGHDSSRIGIYENHFVTLLFECEARLRTRIVEFGCLTYDDRSRADNHNLF